MNRFLHNFLKRTSNIGFWRIVALAILIRLVLAIPFHSGDLNNPAIWGIYAREFGFSGFYDFLNFGNYSRPDYPPLSIVLAWFMRLIWERIFTILWWFNITLPLFPSNSIPWFEHGGYILLLKLPGLIADFLIGIVLYRYFRRRTSGLVAASLYWFNPATIYVSSMWGQADGTIMFLGITSLFALERRKYILGLLFFISSLLIKPTMLMITPVLAYVLFKYRNDWVKIMQSVIVCFLYSSAIVWLFAPWNPILWLFKNYFSKFVFGISANLPYIQLRAFNFWALVTGSQFTDLTMLWFGQTLYTWALLVSFVTYLYVLWLMIKKQNYWGAIALFIFASFLFLPRVHERYLLPILPFLIVFLMKSVKQLKLYIILSFLYVFNLYAAWQVPQSFMIPIISSDIFVRVASLGICFVFLWLLRLYMSLPNKNAA